MQNGAILAGCLLAVAGVLAPSQARADVSSLLSQFNAIVFGNFGSTSDVEGRAIIGGSISVSDNVTFASKLPAGVSSYGLLTVYGDVTSSNGLIFKNAGNVTILGHNSDPLNLNNGGNVYVGSGNSGDLHVNGSTGSVAINGNNTATISMNAAGTVQINGNTGTVSMNSGSLKYSGSVTGSIPSGNPSVTVSQGAVSLTAPVAPLSSFNSTFEAPLKQLSADLAGLADNGSVQSGSGNVTLAAGLASAGVGVLNISSALFSANTNIVIALNGNSSLIVNVTIPGCAGTNCTLDLPSSVHFQSATSIAPYVLWNFVNAGTLDFPTEIGGTVLSPYATVTNHNAIDGTLVAAAFTGQGELHSYAFSGTVPSFTATSHDTPVPEPSTLAVLLSGMAALGWTRFRRRPG